MTLQELQEYEKTADNDELLDAVYERMRSERKALGFLSDSISDNQLASNLSLIQYGMKRTENLVLRLLGRPEVTEGLDVPY